MALKLNLLAPSGALWEGFGNDLESLGTTCELANKLGTTLRQLFGTLQNLSATFGQSEPLPFRQHMAISRYWIAISLCAVSMHGHYSCARKLLMINIIRCAWNKHCITCRLQEVFILMFQTQPFWLCVRISSSSNSIWELCHPSESTSWFSLIRV